MLFQVVLQYGHTPEYPYFQKKALAYFGIIVGGTTIRIFTRNIPLVLYYSEVNGLETNGLDTMASGTEPNVLCLHIHNSKSCSLMVWATVEDSNKQIITWMVSAVCKMYLSNTHLKYLYIKTAIVNILNVTIYFVTQCSLST